MQIEWLHFVAFLGKYSLRVFSNTFANLNEGRNALFGLSPPLAVSILHSEVFKHTGMKELKRS